MRAQKESYSGARNICLFILDPKLLGQPQTSPQGPGVGAGISGLTVQPEPRSQEPLCSQSQEPGALSGAL